MKPGKSVLVFDPAEDVNIVRLVTIEEENIPAQLNGESGFHIYHVRMMTELMLRYLRQTEGYSLTDQEIEDISVAATVHDIGKSKIPRSILEFPGKLSPVEFDIVKKHTTLGARLLENCTFESVSPEIKKYAVDIALYHHERYDGTGYPEGLQGKEIPLCAQVVALADAYDALTSERSYKEAFSQDVAIQMISSGMCGVFDEVLVECLIHVLNHSALVSLREMLYKNRVVVSTNADFAPGHVLCIGNTEYLTKDFVDATFPESKVTVVGNTELGSADQIKLFRIRRPSIQAIFEAYDFDVVVYFSGDLTYRNTEKNDAEELREVLEYAKATGKEMRILFLSSLDSSFSTETDRSILCKAKEDLCQFYARTSLLDIRVVQIPYLYSGCYQNDFLYRIFDKSHAHKTVSMDICPDTKMHFISLPDLSVLITRMLDNWKHQAGILTVGDDFGITMADLSESLRTLCPDATFAFTGCEEIGRLESTNKVVRKEYGWFARISLLEDLPEEYEKYLASRQEKNLTTRQRVKRWAENNSLLVKLTELVVLFFLMEVLVRLTDSAVVFSIVDFRMAYIVIMATVHGLRFGLGAAALSSVSWFVAKVASGMNPMTIFYEPTNWLAFVFFFLVAAVCGYTKLHKDDTIRFVSQQNRLLEDKLIFTREIYEDIYREKRDLKKQIIGAKDSFGKIFDITRKLDTVAPQQLYLRIIETFEEVLENKSITVYSVNSRSAFGRLEVASRDIIQTVSRSISTETYQPIIQKIESGEIWRNTELKAEYPMYAAGVYRQEELVLLIFLWKADTNQRSLYYVNLFKILRDLVQMSLLRAFDHNQIVYEKQYLKNTRIMNEEAFQQVLSNYKTLAEKKVSSYVLLTVDPCGRTYEEMDKLLRGKIRANDVIGVGEDGKLEILMAQATEKDLQFILPRFQNFRIEVK